VWELKKNEW
jgi:hypothetical protein